MRTIKFRSWSETYQRMLYVDVLNLERDVLIAHDKDNKTYTQPLPVKKGVLMQFIGLLDSNGKEIYESDLVELENGEKWEIYWADGVGAFRLKWKEDDYEDMLSPEEMEVIGNIYENKDLLKGL